MGILKMTDILVSTSDFIVTLSHPDKLQKNKDLTEYLQKLDNTPCIIEIIPVSTTQADRRGLADKFFAIVGTKNIKTCWKKHDEKIWDFSRICTRYIWDQILDTLNTGFIENLSHTDLPVLIILRDKAGDIKESVQSNMRDIYLALTHFETGCVFTAISKKTKVLDYPASLHCKHNDFKKDSNRQTHKYFLHHRASK